MFEALALKMARYPPGHRLDKSPCPPGSAASADQVGEADVHISGDTRGRVGGHAPVPRVHRTSEATEDTRTASLQPGCRRPQQGQVGGNDAVTSRVDSAASASLLSSGVAVSGEAGIHLKSPPRNTMVNLVDFVPFLHHRNHSAGTADDATGDQSAKMEDSRDPIDFSDIVPDTQVRLCFQRILSCWADGIAPLRLKNCTCSHAQTYCVRVLGWANSRCRLLIRLVCRMAPRCSRDRRAGLQDRSMPVRVVRPVSRWVPPSRIPRHAHWPRTRLSPPQENPSHSFPSRAILVQEVVMEEVVEVYCPGTMGCSDH